MWLTPLHNLDLDVSFLWKKFPVNEMCCADGLSASSGWRHVFVKFLHFKWQLEIIKQ